MYLHIYMFNCTVLINIYAHTSLGLLVESAYIFRLPYLNCARLQKDKNHHVKDITRYDSSFLRRRL